MGTAQNQRVDWLILDAIQRFRHCDMALLRAEHPLFHKRNKCRTGLADDLDKRGQLLQRSSVGTAFDRTDGADDADLAGFAGTYGCTRTRMNDADDGNGYFG
ncbi:hypothetical protein D3C74_425140 [compost metagenome]